MYKALYVCFLMLLPFRPWSQVWPKEGSALHYRLIGFSFPAVSHTESYKIEIAEGYFNSQDSFRKKIINTVEGNKNKIIAEVPTFGRSYTWQVVHTDKKRSESKLYHFSTKMNLHVDTGLLRLKVLQPAPAQYKDDYVAVDWGGVLYDMSGHAVWYVPDTNGYSGNVADLKFTSQGTATFIYRSLYEINYNGDILWKSPTHGTMLADTVHGELYHHEFKKLANGHYMALGTQLLLCKTISLKDSSYIVVAKEDGRTEKEGYKQGKFGCLIEYDEKGKIVWSWLSSKYLLGADLAYFNPVDSELKYDAHDNSFFFDEKNNCIYVGFRNINRIVKIEYPTGKILRTYGASLKSGIPGVGEGLFCNQHSIGLTTDGDLYYFNNNSCTQNTMPSVVMLQQPVSDFGAPKKVWEYKCPEDGIPNPYFPKGGNAIELSDHTFFVNMGSQYSKLSIVDKNKKVLWSAIPERYIESNNKWMPTYQYRANIITRQVLEKMIWEAQIPVSSR